MLDVTFYDLLMETSNAIAQAMATARERSGESPEARPPILAMRGGLAESPGWFMVQAAEFAPEPLTVPLLRVRNVYAAERLVQGLLELLASEQWLERTPDDTYALTPSGWSMIQRSRERMAHLLSGVTPLASTDMSMLLAWLDRLIQASLASGIPPGTWCVAHSHRRAPHDDAPALVQVLHYLDDFNAFRDDAHMAAWQPYEPSGMAWEAFALLCNGEATSAASVASQLARRGYTPTEYARALASLAKRGWLTALDEPGTYHVTDLGRTVRAQVEHHTDVYFYAPWSCLTDAEITRLHDLLVHLQAGLTA
jgi:hypothetical protein